MKITDCPTHKLNHALHPTSPPFIKRFIARTSRQKLDNEYELSSRAHDSRFRHLLTAASYNFAAVGKAISIISWASLVGSP